MGSYRLAKDSNLLMLICYISIDYALVMQPLHARQSFRVTVAFYYLASFLSILGWMQFWEGAM